MRASTCLRGIMRVDRAKAMTCSRRKPGNGRGNVLMRRGSLGTPPQRVRAERAVEPGVEILRPQQHRHAIVIGRHPSDAPDTITVQAG